MQNSITWVGMDVHAENNVLTAVRGSSDAVLFRAEFPNTPKGRERLAGRLAENVPVRCVYEAGPCGYELRRFLEAGASNATSPPPPSSPENPGTASRQTARTPKNSPGSTDWESWPPSLSQPPHRKRCAISSEPARMPGRTCCAEGTGSPSSSCARGGATPRGCAGRRGIGTGSGRKRLRITTPRPSSVSTSSPSSRKSNASDASNSKSSRSPEARKWEKPSPDRAHCAAWTPSRALRRERGRGPMKENPRRSLAISPRDELAC